MNARVLLAVATAAVVASCAPMRSSISIQSLCAPTDDCVFSATCDAQYIGTYTIATAATPLRLFMQVANQLEDNANAGDGRTNSNNAHITGATIEFEGGRSGSVDIDFANQFVPAGGTAVISFVIPGGTGGGAITANIQLIGYFDNGNDFTTGPFIFNYVVAAIPACPGTTIAACPYNGGLATRVQLPTACVEP